MILRRRSDESWVKAAIRYAGLEGIAPGAVFTQYQALRDQGYPDRTAAYLVLARCGVIDGVEGGEQE